MTQNIHNVISCRGVFTVTVAEDWRSIKTRRS